MVPQFAQAAAPTATLNLSAGTLSSSGVDVTISVDTGGQAVTVVKAVLNLTGLQYVSADASNNDFSALITAAGQSGSTLTLSYGRFDTGYTGSSGKVAVVHLTADSLSAGGSVSVDTTNSQVLAYTDSSNILATGSTATIAPSSAISNSTPTPAASASTATPKASSTPAAQLADTGVDIAPIAFIASLLMLVLCGYQILSRASKS